MPKVWCKCGPDYRCSDCHWCYCNHTLLKNGDGQWWWRCPDGCEKEAYPDTDAMDHARALRHP